MWVMFMQTTQHNLWFYLCSLELWSVYYNRFVRSYSKIRPIGKHYAAKPNENILTMEQFGACSLAEIRLWNFAAVIE